MSDQPFYAPNRKVAPRQPRADEPLWTVEKNGRQLACERSRRSLDVVDGAWPLMPACIRRTSGSGLIA
jgi:hypothetical protein